jgi:hypothetical protein
MFLYSTGHGERDDSVIFHTEEDGKHNRYHKNAVNKDDLQLYCMLHTVCTEIIDEHIVEQE